MNYLATFHTHFDAMQFARYCKKNNIPSEIKPVPRKVSSSCGSCVTFLWDKDNCMDQFTSKELESLYQVQDHDYVLIYHED